MKIKMLIDIEIETEETDEFLEDDIYKNIVKSGRKEGLNYRIVDGCIVETHRHGEPTE